MERKTAEQIFKEWQDIITKHTEGSGKDTQVHSATAHLALLGLAQSLDKISNQEKEAEVDSFIEWVEENYGILSLSQMHDEFKQSKEK